MGLLTDFVEVANEHSKSWVEENVEEEEHHTGGGDVQVPPDVDPCDVGGIHHGIADVDSSEYGAWHFRSEDKRPGIDDPQRLPSVNDTPD